MTNREVFDAFARSADATGGSVRSASGTLYSYSTPIALRRDGEAVFTAQQHSATTAKQKGMAISACQRAGVSVAVVEPPEFRRIAEAAGLTDLGRAS